MILKSQLLSENLNKLLSGFIEVIPNVIGAIIVVILGFIIARILKKITKKIFEKAGIDHLANRLNEIDMIDRARMKIIPSTVLSMVIYYFVVLLFIVGAADVLGMPAVSNLFSNILAWMPNLLTALIILVLGMLFSEMIRKAVFTACNSMGIPSAKMIALFVFYFLFINIFISALTQAKVNTDFISSNLSIIIGGITFAFALGYGLAAKNVLANFLSYYYNKDKFKVGDRIRIGKTKGKIVEVDRTTLLLEDNGTKTIVPLNRLFTDKVEIL